MNIILEHENLKADVVRNFVTYRSNKVHKNFYNNNIQVIFYSFERLLNTKYKDKAFYLFDSDLHELLELLKGGIKCCSEDMKKNYKKIDLRRILEKGKIEVDKFPPIASVGVVSELINFVFANINKIQLNGKLMYLMYHSFLIYYKHKYINNKRLGVVIATILQKNNFAYNDGSTMYQKFKEEYKKYNISTFCDKDDIFFVSKKLYLINKDLGISRFDNIEDFFKNLYLYSKFNAPDSKRYFNLLMRLTNDEDNIFLAKEKLYLVGKDVGIVIFDSFDNFLEHIYSNITQRKVSVMPKI